LLPDYQVFRMAKSTTSQELFSNKVYQGLLRLDTAQRKRLLKFMHSPYFNQSKTLTRLCERLLESAEQDLPGFQRQLVWKKLSGDAPYDDVNFRKHCSDLLKLLEQFMAHESLQMDDTRRSLATLGFIVRQKCEPLYNGAFRQARSFMEENPYHSSEYYHHAYALEKLYFDKMDFGVRLSDRANLEEMSNYLDMYYWIQKLNLYTAVLSQTQTAGYEYHIQFMPEILEFLQHYPVEKTPELAMYYYAFLTVAEQDQPDHYYRLRKTLDQYSGILPAEEALAFYDSALHYCTRRLNMGDRSFLEEYFDLFEAAFHKKVMMPNGELAAWRMNNAVGVAVRLGKLQWAADFTENYKYLLPADSRENTYLFNRARVYRYQGKFDKVLQLLHNVEYEDIGYNLITKAMLTITYYELDELDALDSFLESFRVFLNRNKKTPYRIHHLNLIKYTRKLMRIPPGDKAAAARLRREIEQVRAETVNFEWLMEKLDELARS
jgi:hypothetical protein